MKTNFLKSMRTGSKRRGSLALLSFVSVVLLVFSSSLAQQKASKRVTGLQLGDAFEGSRVTIVSDTALSDYEAYRRGDRFYVKIPLADFASAVPHFRANGFDDVQVQRVGDGLIVSFKLQPGATARVDQRGNRLDVIFSAPNRSSLVASRTAIPASRVDNSQTSAARGPDAAGPLPPGSVAASRDRVVSETAPTDGGISPDPWAINPGGVGGRRGKRGNANNAVAANAQQPTASPGLSPATTSTYPSTYATPISSPAVAAATTSSRRFASLRNSSVYKWISANRLASLLGALILLSLAGYLVMVLRGRRTEEKAKSAKALKVPPKFSETSDLNEPPVSTATTPEVSPVKSEPAARVSDVVSNGSAVRSAPQMKQPAPTPAPTPAPKAAAAVATSRGKGPAEYGNEQEEREVFEL